MANTTFLIRTKTVRVRGAVITETRNIMSTEDIYNLIGLEPERDYEEMNSKEFENLVYSRLVSKIQVRRQVKVYDRGDGRTGKIDFVIIHNGYDIPIEIDRRIPRAKSMTKMNNFRSREAFVVLRSPFMVIKTKHIAK